MKKIVILILCCLFQAATVFAWNANGHRLIAQIAYDNMTEQARHQCNAYNHALDKVYKPLSWVNAAVWLDTLRYQDIAWYESMHYIDIPFSNDGSQLTAQKNNAVWAIEKATKLLKNPYATHFDKGIALRILLHVVGDIHQPMHAISRVSTKLPKGDRGGNLVPLRATPIAKNLHAYWDKGAGFLATKRPFNQPQINKIAASIEEQWPCANNQDMNPMHWAQESHALAVNMAYKPLEGKDTPDKQYETASQKLVIQQIALSGCRLGVLLNALASG